MPSRTRAIPSPDMHRPRRRVLVVDDEPKIVDVVSSYLQRAGFDPVTAATGTQALEVFETTHPVLVILDLMLPDIPGEEVCRRLRARSRVPIIMLTARVEDADAVQGLDLGADDYVTKPFSPRQLMARVEAVLRRAAGESAPLASELSFGDDDLCIDVAAGTVRKRGKPVSLTPRELRLLVHARREPPPHLQPRRAHRARPGGDGLRRLRPHRGRAHQEPAAEDRDRSPRAALHPHRARHGIPLRRGGGRDDLEPADPAHPLLRARGAALRAHGERAGERGAGEQLPRATSGTPRRGKRRRCSRRSAPSSGPTAPGTRPVSPRSAWRRSSRG